MPYLDIGCDALTQESERDRLVCTACLIGVEIPCNCGAPHKRMTPIEHAKEALIKFHGLSYRAIADKIKVSEGTVRNANVSIVATAQDYAVATSLPQLPRRRKGKDGRLRTVFPKSRKEKPPILEDMCKIVPLFPEGTMPCPADAILHPEFKIVKDALDLVMQMTDMQYRVFVLQCVARRGDGTRRTK